LLQIFRRTPAGPKTKVTASSAPKAEKAKSAPVDKKDSGAATTNALSQAEQDAALAETEVADISRKHLATLLALPPRARLTHLDDPELTPGDQNALKLSVRAALPTANKPLRFNLLPWFRKWPIGRRSFATIVLLAIVGWPTGLAWHNTADRLVVSHENWIVDWRLPDGSIMHGAWRAGFPVAVMTPHDGKVVLRYWLAGRGYASTEVDWNWLVQHSYDYVVAPTGATGVVNPASPRSSWRVFLMRTARFA
jgi:hypothetical protein